MYLVASIFAPRTLAGMPPETEVGKLLRAQIANRDQSYLLAVLQISSERGLLNTINLVSTFRPEASS